MKDIVTYASNYDRIVTALHALDAGKRYAPKMTASKSALITAFDTLLIPRLNSGKKAHTFTKAEVAEASHQSLKVAHMAIQMAKQIKLIIPVEEKKFDPKTGLTMAGRYMVNFAFVDETVPRTVSALRLALISSGAYGDDWIKASTTVDRQLESFRIINTERGGKTLTVKRIIELLVEVDGKVWARVVRRARYWSNWEELS